MMCFADKTFCPFLECKNTACNRRLTAEVKAAAKRWFGSDDAPISYYAEKPDCFEGGGLEND